MYYILCKIYKASENNYDQIHNLRPLLEEKTRRHNGLPENTSKYLDRCVSFWW